MKSTKYLLGAIALLIGVVAFCTLWVVLQADPLQPLDQQLQNEAAQQSQVYTCSMHPNVRSDDPHERCPICGMELIAVTAQKTSQEASHQTGESAQPLNFSHRSLALMNVQTDIVRRGTAVKELRLSGILDFDERALTTISAWTSGRIEQLFVNHTGAQVQTGDPLVKIYSPDLLIAQQELLLAQQYLQSPAHNIVQNSSEATYRAARRRLNLLGLNNAQIDEVIQSGEAQDHVVITAPSSGRVISRRVAQGDYVNNGQVLLELADNNHIWAVLDAFESDLEYLNIGQQIQFTLNSNQQALSGRIVSFGPTIEADHRTQQVRVQLTETPTQLTPGSFIQATAAIEVDDALLIPVSAPLITGHRAVVYVRSNEASTDFEMRTIQLGAKLDPFYEVKDGLEAGEIVVSRGAFRIDSERQLQGHSSMMTLTESAHSHEHSTDAEPDLTDISLTPLWNQYQRMWLALHSDDLVSWQQDTQAFINLVNEINWPQEYLDLSNKLLSGAGHIHHVDSLASARELFDNHSQAMIALAEKGQLPSEAHLMFCPMAFNNRGAYWLQADDALLNPYFGASMLRCGEKKKTLPSVNAHRPDHHEGH